MKKILSFVLFLLALIPTTTFAQVDDWDGGAEIWTHGSGTEADPYLIETAENLAWIAEMVNSGVTTYEGVYFKLTTDLNMKNIEWAPIGINYTNLFCGKFDGDNHFIDNISITGNYSHSGLFGVTGDNVIIVNTGVESNINISNSWSGGIVGLINGANTYIENCYNTGNISSFYAGGVIGVSRSDVGTIKNCYNTGTITASISGGGIVASHSGNSTIENCYNTGDVSSNMSSGGIVGGNSKKITIKNCYNTGRNAGPYSGGIVGWSYDTIRTSIENCHNTGNITFNNTDSRDSYSGGIVGRISGSNHYFNNCYNTGEVSSFSSSQKSYAGGIVGNCSTLVLTKCYNRGNVSSDVSGSSANNLFSYCGGLVGYGDINILYCYNRGDVSAYGNTNNCTVRVGGLVGTNNGGSTFVNSYNTGMLTGSPAAGIAMPSGSNVINCYYLETCGGTVGGGTPKTEAAMKSTSFPIMLNADSTVFVMDLIPNVNDGYPIFGGSVCEVFTNEASNIGFTSATLNGTYSQYEYWPGGDVDVMGFEYKLSTVSNYTTVYNNIGTTASYNLTDLQSGTTYNYRMFIQKNGNTYYGQEVTFSTLACDLQVLVTPSSSEICNGNSATFTALCSSEHSDLFTYQWNNDITGNIIQVNDAAIYTVTVQDTNGCSATASASVVLRPLPQGVISGNTSLCAGESSILTASGANSYTWNTGASTPTLTVNESGTYTCTFRNSYGCTSTQSVEVTVFSSPVITGETAFCAGGNTTLAASGGNSYVWSNGATTPSISVSTPGTYSVTGTSTGGCSGSSTVTVVQRELPSVSIYGTPVICSGIGAELTATEGSSYQWSTGETTKSITANHTGNYSVLVTDANGCSNTTSVEVSSLTSVSISGNTSICQGETATLSVEIEGEYLWSTGAQTSLISVSNAGVYSVTVSLPNGCSTSATANVSVNALPVLTINGNTAFCEGQSTMLYANGGTSYQWNSGTSGSTLMVNAEGNYTVTATNAHGCTATASTYVTVYPLPNITISGNTSTCQGNQVILTANGAQSYQWNTGSTNATIMVGSTGNFTVIGYSAQGCSNTASTSVSVYPTYNTPISQSICEGETYNFFGQNLTTAGTYTYPLYSVHGCDSIITLTLTVREVPVVSISGNTSFCQGENSTLVANGGVSYNWSTGSTGSNLYVSESGAYTVTANNAQGCSATATTYVTVNELPTVTISGNTEVCQGTATTLTANGAATYQWSNGTNGANNTVDVFGNYTVTGTSTAGCSSTATTTVIVYSLPVINISGETEICQGSSTTLTANGAETYLWNNGTTDATLTTSNAGTYTVIGTDEHGCYSTESVDVVVYYPTDEDIYVSETGSYEWHDSTYTESGDYTWTGQTIHGCDSVVTLHLTITPTDTTGIATYDGSDITLYPNPTMGIVTVQYSMNNVQLADAVEIHVFDVYGRMLSVVVGVNDYSPLRTVQIDLSNYATGIYLVKLVNDGKVVATGKVVKQ